MIKITTIIILILLICGGLIALWLDKRNRLILRQVKKAVSTEHAQAISSIQRQHLTSQKKIFFQLTNYTKDVTYLWRPELIFFLGLASIVAVFYLNYFFEFPLIYVTLFSICMGLIVIRTLFEWQRRVFINKLFRQLPDTLEMIISAVKSGLPLNEAFRIVTQEMAEPTAGQFKILMSDIHFGRPSQDAITDIYLRTGLEEYNFLATTIAVQIKTGGRLAETLQTLSTTIRQRVTLAARAKALAGEVIFSARALSAAPLIMGGVLYFVSPNLVDLLFTDPTGKKLLAYALASILVGSLVIRWMVRRETSL